MVVPADAIGTENQEGGSEHYAEEHLHSLMADLVNNRRFGAAIGNLRSALGTQ